MPHVLGLSNEGGHQHLVSQIRNLSSPLLLLVPIVTCVSNHILCAAHGSDFTCLYKKQLSGVRTEMK